MTLFGDFVFNDTRACATQALFRDLMPALDYEEKLQRELMSQHVQEKEFYEQVIWILCFNAHGYICFCIYGYIKFYINMRRRSMNRSGT